MQRIENYFPRYSGHNSSALFMLGAEMLSGHLNKKRRVLLAGYYGFKNTGDDALCAIACWGAKKFWGVQDVGVLARIIPKLPMEAEKILTSDQMFRGQNKLETIKALWEADNLVFAGGSIFHGDAGSARRIIKYSQKIMSTRSGAIGVSIGPFKDLQGRRRVKNFLKRFDFLVVRDKRSFLEAAELNLPFAPLEAFDLAGMMPLVYPIPKIDRRSEKLIIGLAACHYERYVGGNGDD